jgi:Zinc carboxypeptidase
LKKSAATFRAAWSVVLLIIAGSSQLLAQDKQAWLTPAEKSDYRTTPDYNQTMAYLERIAQAAPKQVRLETFGKTGEGRDLYIVIASGDGVFDPAKLHAAKRPIVLVQNSIHAGEMDGKDSCLALLRDMVITRSQAVLLDRAVFVFIPIYNADGHERRSKYNRINQNGPEEMGWRTNGSNINLNRDYMKAAAPETRAFLSMFHRWLPDFFVDDHVTDGADYQYDVTFIIDSGPDVASGTAKWVSETVTPFLEKAVNDAGHVASPTYITLNDDTDPAQGLGFNDNPPRFSTGYMILENRPGMLVELHMLKDYKTRVTGNYELLRGLLQIVNRDADQLIALNQRDDEEAARLGAHPLANAPFPLAIGWSGETTPFLFRGYRATRKLSEVSGAMWVEYSHEPWNVSLPFQTGAKVIASTVPPAAYIVPAQWTQVVDVLQAHQVEMVRTTAPWTGTVETYRCSAMEWQGPPFEGKHPLFAGEGSHGKPGKFGQCTLVTDTVTYPAGSAVVLLNQRLSKVAIQWLEPQGPDSAMAWGFFDPIFEQKEYGEAYVLEKLAREMMAKDPKLKAEFERKVQTDPRFAANPAARLEFFYDRSPWADSQLGLYPVGRLTKLDTLPLK